MNIRKDTPRSSRVREQATYWYVELQNSNLSQQKLRRWQKWSAVPEHKRAFDECEESWVLIGGARVPPWPSEAAVNADTYDGSMPVDEYQKQRRRKCALGRHRVWPIWTGVAIAASVVIAVGIAFNPFDANERRPVPPFSVFETAAAQHENVVLMDGSQIKLGARTAVTSNVSRDVRFIVMDRGEALFQVAHDPKRPFRVLAGGGIITAVGTAFNVRRLDNLVIVTVSEGTVEVAPASAVDARDGSGYPYGKRVTAGQEISYDAQGRMGEVRVVNIDLTMSWRDGLLQYESEPLNQVVQDINRYSRKTVTIADADAAELLYTGTVFERDIDDWLTALPATFDDKIEVSESDSRHVFIKSKDN
jgi:transmembrane sensor